MSRLEKLELHWSKNDDLSVDVGEHRLMIRIGIVGYGHWGPNHVRVINECKDARVVMVGDLDASRRAAASQAHPGLVTTELPEEVVTSPNIDAVIVSTPVVTHHSIAMSALNAGKHVLVEKPLCQTTHEADELVALSRQQDRVLMCGHVFLFNAGVRRLREYIYDDVIGTVRYMAATRTNLGPFRTDVNVLYDLACHDISFFSFLLGALPESGNAVASSFLQPGIEDVVFGSLKYPGGALCHFHDSWVNPRKERTLVVVGDKKMVVWDDMNSVEPIRLYDKGVQHDQYYDTFSEFRTQIRDGDVLIPRVNQCEPLKAQDHHFVECIRDGMTPLSGGQEAREVVKILETLQRSIKNEGRQEVLHWDV